ncbi:outer membrane protein assembly factor BamE [Deefgea salmonis]|uniref:Outer membrane protein assembly factor BamE n=1 Tax=Deefgea salmonis TaxID=2875502 RepID=A0ABS8BKW9_9NEIS|nr:outer membrane protein assembly factor BamE [Deefgea salmonis]MCB5196252.1 outer membrane protein assembly factor BamE [Deefgea salmonis]
MKARLLTAFVTGSLLLSGCSVVNFITPYKLDIPQGNEITAKQVALLRVGMTRSQVRFALGTPLLTDPFHKDRWDYIYRDSRGGKVKEAKNFVVFFNENSLVRWDGDYLPDPKAEPAEKTQPLPPSNDNLLMPIDPSNPDSKIIEVKPLMNEGF